MEKKAKIKIIVLAVITTVIVITTVAFIILDERKISRNSLEKILTHKNCYIKKLNLKNNNIKSHTKSRIHIILNLK